MVGSAAMGGILLGLMEGVGHLLSLHHRAKTKTLVEFAEALRDNTRVKDEKGIQSLIQALQHNATLTELCFQNQHHICRGKTEMEMTKVLKENATLLKLGYHFQLQGPRMTMTNILSRNMDRQTQKRLQEQ